MKTEGTDEVMESIEKTQTAHTCNLILLYTLLEKNK